MKTAEELGITETQRANLAALAVYWRDYDGPMRFNIGEFGVLPKAADKDEDAEPDASNSPDEFRLAHACGSAGCLIGGGAIAGIGLENDTTNWGEYTRVAYGAGMRVEYADVVGDLHERIYLMLFHFDHFDDIMAGLRRLAYFLDHGLLPWAADDNARVQANALTDWEAPADYEPDWEAIEELAATVKLNPAPVVVLTEDA